MEQYIPKSVVLAGIKRSSKIIDSLQEEPVSEFLNTESMIESYKQRLISQANGVKNSPFIDMCLVSYKHGINETLDTLNLSNVQRTTKKSNTSEVTSEVSEDFEEALAKEWQGYVDRGAATVDALEDNTQELAFAKGFYRGSKWQKNQGVTKEAVIGMATEEISINISQSTLDALDLCAGDKVIIQIRKKED